MGFLVYLFSWVFEIKLIWGVDMQEENENKPMTLTEMIFNSKSPYNNQFQGGDTRVLFVCSAGLLRSATAARIYAKKYNTRAAESAPYALIPLGSTITIYLLYHYTKKRGTLAPPFSYYLVIRLACCQSCCLTVHSLSSCLKSEFTNQYTILCVSGLWCILLCDWS